jgi:hypothetical protein
MILILSIVASSEFAKSECKWWWELAVSQQK